AQAQHEVLDAVHRIALHDVPQDRTLPDRHHRLGLELRLLAQTRALSAAQDDRLHGRLLRDKVAIAGHFGAQDSPAIGALAERAAPASLARQSSVPGLLPNWYLLCPHSPTSWNRAIDLRPFRRRPKRPLRTAFSSAFPSPLGSRS